MMTSIIQNEWRALSRSRVVVWLTAILTVLSFFTIWQAVQKFNAAHRYQEQSAQYMRQKFTGQGEVNPHNAVHYGHFVYKPLSTLSVLDDGVNPFTGISLRLEGHQQNETMFAPSQNSSSLVRFGQLNLSLVLQVLLPLFIIFVCHNAISAEKENGNLSVSIMQGASLRRLAWGKVISYASLWLGFLTIIMSVLWLATTSVTNVPLSRLAGLWFLYGGYYFLITALSVYVSASSKNSANALLKLLFAWLVCTVLLPKATANIGENITPLISRIELESRITEDNKNGINGHDPSNERTKRFNDSLMKTYKADSIANIPVNRDGLTMQADEEYHNIVYDKHFGTVQDLINKQNRVGKSSSWLNPFASVRNLSMSLSGTDVYHHFDFTDKAEAYRRVIIKRMNDEQAYGGSKTGDWNWTVKGDFWNKIDDFNYQQPATIWSLQHNSQEMIALLVWLLFVIGLIHLTINRLSII